MVNLFNLFVALQAIRKISEVKNNKLVINLPKGFSQNKVEVIILPVQEDEDEFWLDASKTSLKDIWNNKEDDEYEKLL